MDIKKMYISGAVPMSDILSIEHSFEVDAVHALVGAFDGFF